MGILRMSIKTFAELRAGCHEKAEGTAFKDPVDLALKAVQVGMEIANLIQKVAAANLEVAKEKFLMFGLDSIATQLKITSAWLSLIGGMKLYPCLSPAMAHPTR